MRKAQAGREEALESAVLPALVIPVDAAIG